MSKVSVVLNYWIFIIIVLLMSKVTGVSDDNKMMIVTLGFATLFYVMFTMYKARRESSRGGGASKAGRGLEKGLKNKRKS